MTKRRITKQQTARIQKNQASYHEKSQNIDNLSTETAHLNQPGLVITRYGRHAEIETPEKTRVHCAIRSNMGSIVAGDQIIWQKTGNDQGVIVSCCPRQSVLGRPAFRGEYKAVAANITQMLIVVAPKPEMSWLLLDSYLVMADLLKLKVVIILNKVDLPCEAIQSELKRHYEPLDYPILFSKKEDLDAIQQIKDRLKDEISVFIGQSGVGKSSLIAQVLPHETLTIGDISKNSELGCHTTSNSRLYNLPTGGKLIDSPGVRAFGLWKASKQDIIYGFREFRGLAGQCKYRNCTHINTPHCAILNAVNNGTCSTRRYEDLITLLEQAVSEG